MTLRLISKPCSQIQAWVFQSMLAD